MLHAVVRSLMQLQLSVMRVSVRAKEWYIVIDIWLSTKITHDSRFGSEHRGFQISSLLSCYTRTGLPRANRHANIP